MTLVDFALDSILAIGWIAVIILAIGVALLVTGLSVALGRWTGMRLAIRYHARRLIRDAQLYANRPALRGLFDTHDQPRKEM